MVLLRNSLLQKCVPEQMSWSAAEREILCTTKKFVKSVSAWITSQPIKINGKSSAYFLSLFLYWCDASSCTSHAWRSALIVQHTETVLYHTLPANFGVRFFLRDSSPGSSLSASRFSMVIWNDWKQKSSHQGVTHKSRNWTKHYDWSAG